MTVKYGSLLFDKAVRYLRKKTNITTESYMDIVRESHIQAFTVAGAMKMELLQDLRSHVDEAIADGISIQEFRKKFDATVKNFGWNYKGGRDWRTRVIYKTNINQAYNAGRWQQTQESPSEYLMYRHSGSENPRLTHKSWDRLILPKNSPEWDTKYPQNGWGCDCRVFPISKERVQRAGLAVTDELPGEPDADFAYNPGKNNKGYKKAAEKTKKNFIKTFDSKN